MERNETTAMEAAGRSKSCDAQAAGGCSADACGQASGVRPGESARERPDNLGIELTADDASDGVMARRAVTAEETSKILSLHHAEGWPIGTIGTQLGRHHDTVERVLAQSGLEVHKESARPRLVDAYLPFLKETLAKYPRLGASRLWSMAKARGYAGSKSGFRAIVSRLRPRRAAEAYLRRRVLPGQEAQVDWAHFGKITIGRAIRDLWVFVMVLSYSRLRFLIFSLRAAMPSFLAGHVKAFRFFKAAPRTVLYDNLRSAVLEREGDAVRFHPTLLALAGHYRFEPRACAPYRPNEKGRVERAIRDARENFFAAREYKSIADLNEQARAWCLEIAKERKVPDARDTTCEAAFLEERSKMIELPGDDFPIEERVEVRVGKTPYVRFDKNDYSVPHTHVQRSLTVRATNDRVRVVDPEAPTEVLADHPRTFDRDQRVESSGHLQALVEQKRRAHQSRGFDRIFGVVPSSRAMMEHIAEHGGNLGATTSGLLQMLDRVGAEMLERAVAEVIVRDQMNLRAIHHVLDRLRHEAGQPPPLSVPVTTDARAMVQVRPHALSTYDQLHEGADHDEANGGDDEDAR
jgi:transposase